MASLMTALIGPFGTYEGQPFSTRFLYWSSLIFGALLPAFAIQRFMFRYLKGPVVVVDMISAIIIGLVIGTGIWAFNVWVMEFPLRNGSAYALHLLVTLLICCVPVAIRASLKVTPDVAAPDPVPDPVHVPDPALTPPPAPEVTPQVSAFMRRLEPEDRGRLMSVSADNHQLEVWTDRGQTRLWLRFRDALHELNDLPGVRIHRSHWVAYEAIKSVETNGRRIEVTLQCGRVLPVSAMGVDPLRAAGLLEG